MIPPAATEPPPGNPSRPRVLIVDDTPANIEILLETLKHDFALVAATSGQGALDLATGPRPPEVILLDIMMPGLDGYETCRRLKADPRTEAIPVIFVTGMNQVEDEALGLSLGAVDYIAKPFSPTLVRARVANHVQLYRTRRQLERKNYDADRANAELKRQNELMHNILGQAVHGLRNPLTVISGFAQLLDMMASSGTVPHGKDREIIGRLQQAIKHMETTVSDILASERIEASHVKLDRRPVDLAVLVGNVCDLNQVHATGKKLEIIRDLSANLIVNIDSQCFRDVIDNLISNAIKFSPPGKRIWVSISQQDQGSTLCVRDEGPGLTDEDQTRLYGRFAKLSARPTGGESSSGLGLSIVKRLVELHGGTITAQSSVGIGTSFTVALPDMG